MSRLTQEHYQSLADVYGNTREWKRFNYCQAWISNRIYNSAYNVDFKLVKSYNTIVAVADYTNKKFIRLGKWSQTTSKQSTQIRNTFYKDFEDIQL